MTIYCSSLLDLRGAQLCGVDLRPLRLSGATMENANLTFANLEDMDLTNAQLQWANCRQARFGRADLSDAHLSDADFSEVKARRCKFQGAIMPAKMLEADLEEADFTDAKFPNTDMTDAEFRGANLTGADLRGMFYWIDWGGKHEAEDDSVRITQEQLDNAVADPDRPPNLGVRQRLVWRGKVPFKRRDLTGCPDYVDGNSRILPQLAPPVHYDGTHRPGVPDRILVTQDSWQSSTAWSQGNALSLNQFC